MQKKYITLLLVILATALTFAGARYGLGKYKNYLSDQKYSRKIDTIHAFFLKKDDETFHQKTDRLHDFVRDNSQHNEDEEFYSNWPDRIKLADSFIAGLEGKRKDKPHMECSTRSNILSALYEKEGYRVRNIVLYAPDEELANHRIIEVLNPETKQWEAHDVTYDVYFASKTTRARVSTAETAENPHDHEPCNTKGHCGWDLKTMDGHRAEKLKTYLKIITVHDKEIDLRISMHTPDISPNRVFKPKDKAPGTFCEIFSKNCENGFYSVSERLLKVKSF